MRTVHGDVIRAIRDTDGPFSFVHLDFLGHLTDEVASALKSIRRRMTSGGVIAYTFLRARESAKTPQWSEAKSLAEDPSDFDAVRFHGVADIICDILNGTVSLPGSRRYLPGDVPRSVFRAIGALAYHSGKSPMGILIFLCLNVGERLTKTGVINGYFANDVIYSIKKNAREIVRDLAIAMVDRPSLHSALEVIKRPSFYRPYGGGISSATAADILNVSEGTVRAWLAHRAMGTYERKTA